jgi:hypothetical protein
MEKEKMLGIMQALCPVIAVNPRILAAFPGS